MCVSNMAAPLKPKSSVVCLVPHEYFLINIWKLEGEGRVHDSASQLTFNNPLSPLTPRLIQLYV